MAPDRARRLGEAAALALVLGVAGAIGAWIVAGGRPAGLFSDSIDYLRYADFYRGLFGGEASPGAAEAYRISRFPPLYPLLLALCGAGAEQAGRALAVTNATAVLAAGVVWLWLRRERAAPWLATLGALAVVLTPAWLRWLLEPVSEPLLVLLMAGACALAARPGDSRSGSRVLAVAALLGLIPLARMAALAFVAAGLQWVWRQRDLDVRTRALATAAMLLPAGAWMAYRSLALGAESYVGAAADTGAPFQVTGAGTWLARETWRIVEGIGLLWYPDGGALAAAMAVAVLVLAGAGVVARLRRNTVDAAGLPCYLALVLVWPYPAETERLLVVIVPLLVVAAIDGTRLLAARTVPRAAAAAPIVAPALLLALALPVLARFASRAAAPMDDALSPYKRAPAYLTDPSDAFARSIPEILLRMQLTIEALPGVLPPRACVYASAPALVRQWAGVPAVRYPRGLADAAQAQRELTRCGYFLVIATDTPQYDEPALYPLDQLAGWTRPVIANYYEDVAGRRLAAAVLRRE